MTYGCYNRAPFKDTVETVSVEPVRTHGTFESSWAVGVVTRSWPNVFTKHCHYRETEIGKADPGCVGCKWREE